ncbi:uncharacterized protein BYT42DRAFT_538620 [Radiomyces spectabilis]|uniref:uncharacterized protein n=1 Tax=Radiomyces spectabilis TaxID=64574 RepID=UPI0022211FA7|nr:uncharacterized protein BYT42DRAFT_538620 [Radiomyces spectabilis]KAI8369349.1 hypothetical protein BYT42DRAFT_538620 [Radiomyces spectabilis]
MNLDIYEPKADDHFMIDEFDISKVFYNFQVSMHKRILQGECLKMESHVQYVLLLLSSIFLVKPKRFHDNFVQYIYDTVLEKVVKDLAKKFDICTHTINLDHMSRVFSLIDECLTTKSTEMKRLSRSCS